MRNSFVSHSGFADQSLGTAGLRRPRAQALAPHYIENFVQAVVDILGGHDPVFIAGDGRYGNVEAITRSLAVLGANGIRDFSLAHGLLATTPALSAILAQQSHGFGLMFSASHNPPDDFGLKVMLAGGEQAGVDLSRKIGERARSLRRYAHLQLPRLDFHSPGPLRVPGLDIVVIDPYTRYLELLDGQFDFERIRSLLAGGPRLVFDAMHGASGPIAQRLFVDKLGLADEWLLRVDPRPDFGGDAPDPNLSTMAALIQRLQGPQAPWLAAACDGDGDRNFLHAPGCFISPGDSVAVLADRLALCPGYSSGLRGVARTFATSSALDRVARDRGLELFVTPSGWRHFGPLLASGKIDLCGEEAFGTSGSHLREKDGLWAILAWLNIMAATGLSAARLMHDHWQRYGCTHYRRWDFENLDPVSVSAALDQLRRSSFENLRGRGGNLSTAGEFCYQDPRSGQVIDRQGYELRFADGARLVVRQSGTTSGLATLRLYLERHRAGTGDSDQMLASLGHMARGLPGLGTLLSERQPDVVT